METAKLGEEIRGAVARGWCHPKNASKVMDSDLALAISEEVEQFVTQHCQVLQLEPDRELYVAYTTPRGEQGFFSASDLLAIETCDELKTTCIKLADGTILQASETAIELMKRTMMENANA